MGNIRIMACTLMTNSRGNQVDFKFDQMEPKKFLSWTNDPASGCFPLLTNEICNS